MYVLYSALLAVFLLMTLPYWLLQMLRHGKYRAGLRQRFGAVPPHLLEKTGDQPDDLGARRLCRRGRGVERGGRSVAAGISVPSRADLDHHQHRTEACGKEVWRRKRFLLSRSTSPLPCALTSRLCGLNSASLPKQNSGRIFCGWLRAAGLASPSSTAASPTARCPATNALRFWLAESAGERRSVFWRRPKRTGERLVEIGALESKIAGRRQLEIRCAAASVARHRGQPARLFDRSGAGTDSGLRQHA